jgi:hypothetical protein
MFKKLFGNRKGQTGIAIALIITLVALSVIIPIGMWVTGLIFTSIPQSGWTAAANTTMTTLQSNVWAAYSLSTILPIIAVAGVIIASITGFIVWRRSGQ